VNRWSGGAFRENQTGGASEDRGVPAERECFRGLARSSCKAKMSQEERQPLLPRPPVAKTRHSLPDRVLRQGNPFSVSPGGQSWNKRLSEGAGGSTSPPARSPLAVPTSPRQRTTSRVSESAEEESADGTGRNRLISDRSRRPYHYNSQVDLQGQPMAGTVEADPVEEAHYRRYQYYTRLQNQTGVNLDVLNIPGHAIPASFFQIQFLGVSPAAGKQSSIVTIFAIWNTMMGTSLLSMPWALEQAGLVMGLLMMVLISGMCLYTAYRIIQVYTIHRLDPKGGEGGS